MTTLCHHCWKITHSQPRVAGGPVYCDRVCFGLSRRDGKTTEQKKAAKAAYDKERRAKLGQALKEQKRQRYQETMTPEKRAKEKAYRDANMARHVEYCSRPEYQAWKAKYDRERRFAEFGEHAEAAMILEDLEREIRRQATAYEVRVQQGYYTRNAQKRRRELWQMIRRT